MNTAGSRQKAGPRTRARLSIGLAALLAVGALTVAAVAYACVKQATITLEPEAASPGDAVSGRGDGFRPALPVEVRLGTTGPLLWSGPADALGRLAFSFRAPNIEPGYHVITAAGRGSSGDPARAVLQVKAPPPGPAGGGPTPNREEQTGARQPAGNVDEQPSRTREQRSSRGGSTPLESRRSASRVTPTGDFGPRGDTGLSGDARPRAGASATREGRAANGRRAGSLGPDPFAPAGPSERSASGDLWPGFTSRNAPSLLTDASQPAPAASGPTGWLTAGIAVGAVGLMALLGGFGVAEARRRRRPAVGDQR